MTPQQFTRAVADTWKVWTAIGAIFLAGMLFSAFISTGKGMPSRLEALERADSVAANDGTAYTRQLAQEIAAQSRRIDLLEPAVRYSTCVELERRKGRDGGACEYFIEGQLDLFRPPAGAR